MKAPSDFRGSKRPNYLSMNQSMIGNELGLSFSALRPNTSVALPVRPDTLSTLLNSVAQLPHVEALGLAVPDPHYTVHDNRINVVADIALDERFDWIEDRRVPGRIATIEIEARMIIPPPGVRARAAG